MSILLKADSPDIHAHLPDLTGFQRISRAGEQPPGAGGFAISPAMIRPPVPRCAVMTSSGPAPASRWPPGRAIAPGQATAAGRRATSALPSSTSSTWPFFTYGASASRTSSAMSFSRDPGRPCHARP